MNDNLEIFKIQISYLPLDKLKNIHTILSNKNINFESLKSMDIPLKVGMNSDNMLNEINNEINKREDMLKSLTLKSRDELYDITSNLLSIPDNKIVTFVYLKNIGLDIKSNNMNDDKVSKAFFIDIMHKAAYELEQKEIQIRNNERRNMSVPNNRPLTQRMMGSVRNIYGRVKNAGKDPKGTIGLWTLEMRDKYKILKQKLRENIQHRLYMLEKEKQDLMKNEDLSGGKYKNPKKSRKLHHRLKRKRLRTRRRHMHRLR